MPLRLPSAALNRGAMAMDLTLPSYIPQTECCFSELDPTLPLWVLPISLTQSLGGEGVQGSKEDPTSAGLGHKIRSPPGLKLTHDFKIKFTGYDPGKHAEFELVPRLIGRAGCNMASIRTKTGAGVCVSGRGSGKLEAAAPNGELVERDEPLHMAVSCRSRLGRISEDCAFLALTPLSAEG